MKPLIQTSWLDDEIARCDAIVRKCFDYSGSHDLKKILKQTHIGGKRLRPTLIFLCARLGENRKDLDNVAYCAAVTELLHLASLFHDDVLDNTVIRRKKLTPQVELGNKVSILLGDYILAESMEILARHLPPAITLEYTAILKSMVKSEILARKNTSNFDLSKMEYLEIIRSKTASLFSFAAYSGIALVSNNSGLVSRIKSFGHHIGTAYQLVDDLEDLWGLTDNADNDLANGYISLPIIELMKKLSGKTRDQFIGVLKESEDLFDKIEILRTMFSYSVFHTVYSEIMKYVDKAKSILADIDHDEVTRILHSFCDMLKDRALDTIRSYEQLANEKVSAAQG